MWEFLINLLNTRRMRDTEKRLRDSEAHYAALVESLPLSAFRKDLNGKFVFANQRFCNAVNRQPKDILTLTDFDLFPEKLAKKYRQDDRRVIETGQVIEETEENQRHDGTLSYVHVLKSPVRDGEGHVIGIQGLFWDETARRQAEEARRASEERFHLAVRGSSDGIWDWNIATDEIYYSPRFKELIGFCDQEFADDFSSWETHLHPDDRQNVLDALQRHLKQRTPYEVEFRLRTKSGEHRWFLGRGQAIWNDSGRAIRMAGSITDITRRKQSQEALRRAKEAAESGSRAKSIFLANMSHEIRTPLNGVIGIAELLLETKLTPEQHEYVTLMRDSGKSLTRVIDDVLDFSKIEAGKLEFHESEFDLRECLGDTIKSLAFRAHAKGLELSYEVDSQIPRVFDW